MSLIASILSFWSGSIRDAYSQNKTSQIGQELDREIQKNSPRFLTNEQKNILTSELKGKINKVNILIQRDAEARRFALELEIALQNAGISLSLVDLAPGEILSVPTQGVIMYRPGGFGDEKAVKNDPLYLALDKANLYAGNVSLPWISIEKLSLGPTLSSDEYAIYVGQKHPQ
jgi:hypothetical protein